MGCVSDIHQRKRIHHSDQGKDFFLPKRLTLQKFLYSVILFCLQLQHFFLSGIPYHIGVRNSNRMIGETFWRVWSHCDTLKMALLPVSLLFATLGSDQSDLYENVFKLRCRALIPRGEKHCQLPPHLVLPQAPPRHPAPFFRHSSEFYHFFIQSFFKLSNLNNVFWISFSCSGKGEGKHLSRTDSWILHHRIHPPFVDFCQICMPKNDRYTIDWGGTIYIFSSISYRSIETPTTTPQSLFFLRAAPLLILPILSLYISLHMVLPVYL